jgi:hypothetical protein
MAKDFFTIHLIPDDKILIASIGQLLPHRQNSPFFACIKASGAEYICGLERHRYHDSRCKSVNSMFSAYSA